MKVLIINSGSSSLKYQLIQMEDESVLASGYCEKVTIPGSFTNHTAHSQKVKTERELPTHKEAVELMIELLTTGENKVIDSISEIDAIGHRVVHGGEKFKNSILVTDEIVNEIDALSPLAPLHNPAGVIGLRECRNIFGSEIPMVAVFDTSFHQTMEPYAYLYALPYEYYEKYQVRRYGFHGTSHQFVSERVATLMGKPLEELKIISCHLGNGASVCAINKGRVQDTSMGLTPLEGLMMGTRSGDLDPAVIKFLMEKENISVQDLDTILNKKSGFIGVSGISNDQRDVENASFEGNERALLAIKMYEYRIAKYIGAYVAAMNGVDTILFTAGIGENAIHRRENVISYLGYLGIMLDREKNDLGKQEGEISTNDSKVKVFVIPTNEELMIARETEKMVEFKKHTV